MTPKNRNKRLGAIALGAVFLSGAALLVSTALEQNIAYFHTPSTALAEGVTPQTRIRLGGMVEDGSIVKGPGLELRFRVADQSHSVTVFYEGQPPDLLREGQAAVAQGRFTPSGEFHADTILAKHDENYIPPELVDLMDAKKEKPSNYVY